MAAHSPPRTIAGVCAAARPVPVAALARVDQSLLVVVPSPGDAEALHAGLAFVAPQLPAAYLAAEAVETYGARPLSLGASAAAAIDLARLARRHLQVLIAPARLLLHPLPPPSLVAKRTVVLRRGDRLGRDDFVATLLAEGYRRTAVATEAGEVAVRGEICDVCTLEGCVRLVLEVDRIDPLRTFDPTSQRTESEPLDEFTVSPLRLFPADAAARYRLATRLESDGYGEVAALVREELHREVWEGMLSLAHESQPLWSMVDRLVVCEPADVLTEIERAIKAAQHNWSTLALHGHALPPPERVLYGRQLCAEALAGADRVVELALTEGEPTVTLHTAPAPSHAS
ncbi:MAG: hypothetical protein HRF46_00840, partial [Acidobacteriota bacterium]